MGLAVEPKAHHRIAQQQQKCQQRLFYQRQKRFGRISQR